MANLCLDWMSIAFGGICIFCSLFLKNVRSFVDTR